MPTLSRYILRRSQCVKMISLLYIWLLLCVVGLSGCASGPGVNFSRADEALQLEFPQAIAGVPFQGRYDYQAADLSGVAGTLRNYKYANRITAIDVFSYTGSLTSIEDGVTSAVEAEFELAKQEIFALQASGYYAEVEPLQNQTVMLGGQSYLLHTARLSRGGEMYSSYLLLTARNQHFLKIRVTTLRDTATVGFVWTDIKQQWLDQGL